MSSARHRFAEARDRLHADALPHAILADYHLDHGTGIDAIVALRELHGNIPAVLITADRSEIVRALAAASDVLILHKPLRPAALRAALMRGRVQGVAAE